MCPEVLKICANCKLRGHSAGAFCLEGKTKLLRFFEQVADRHFYLQYRRTIYSWGHVYIPSRRAADRIASQFDYDTWAHLPVLKAKEVLEKASAPPPQPTQAALLNK